MQKALPEVHDVTNNFQMRVHGKDYGVTSQCFVEE